MALRARLVAGLLIVLATGALVHYTQVWAAIPAAQARTSDYAGTYVASTLWRQGRAGSLYDVPAEEAVMAAAGAPAAHLYIPFENPPFAAVVASPLSLLDATTAYRLWSLLQLALLGAAVAVAARAAPWPARRPRPAALAVCLVAFAGFGAGLLFVEGQWDGVSALGIAIAYAGWRRGARAGPGFAIGFSAALAKPHLALGIAAYMLGRRDWRGISGAAAGAATVGIGGLLAAGPGALGSFVRAVLQPANSPAMQMEGATGLVGSLLGGGTAPLLLSLLLEGAAVVAAGRLGVLARRHPGLSEPALLGAVALSLFASPHLLGHDLTLLAPALVAALAWGMRRELRTAGRWPGGVTLALLGGWVALSLSSLLDLGQTGVGFPGRLTPWILLAACTGLTVATHRAAGALAAAPRVTPARMVPAAG